MSDQQAAFELEQLLSWRVEQLLELGCALDDATLLACSDVSLDEARALRAKGCPPRLLVRILA